MITVVRRNWHLVIAAVLVVVVVFGGLSLVTVSSARQAQWWVSHSQTVIKEARALLTDLTAAESAGRGYFITGDPAHLAALREAETSLPDRLVHLRQLTADNPGQQVRLEEMTALVTSKLDLLGKLVSNPPLSDHGQIERTVMTRFRQVESTFEAEEERLFAMRSAALESRYELILGCYGTFATMVGIGAVFFILRLKHSEQRLRLAEETARQAQKMEAVGQLTGGIAHDFNNILQAVMTNLDLATRKLESNREARDFIQTAMAGLEKGATLTAQLLAFARRQTLRLAPVAIDRLLTDTAGFLQRTLGEKYQVEVVNGAGLWRALTDPQLLQNALLNLALNARDAMPDGGRLTLEAANVTLDGDYAARESEVEPGPYVMLAVSDTGCGMPPETVAQAFEPFFTTKADGTGLGLAMVYGFIKQSRGHLKIYSEPGQGTTVKLYLPRTTREEDVREEKGDSPLRGEGLTVLVVEDDDAVRAGAVTQLSDLGYKVMAAIDGDSALEILSRDPSIDLLFTDVILAGEIGGRQLAERARQIRPRLPVVYTSGYTENAIVHHGRLDADAILLSKPYRRADLARVIGNALASRNRAPAAGADRDGVSARAAPRRVLVVEDDDLVREGLVMTLEMMGHQVKAAETATQALSLIERMPDLDLLVSDLGLPDTSGLELAAAVRRQRPRLDIIITSGYPPMRAEQERIEGPPIGWLVKPISPSRLQAAIEGQPAAG